MKKIKQMILPIIILTLFIAMMTTGGWIKQPLSQKDDVMYEVTLVEEDVKVSDWNLALEHMEQLDRAWRIVLSRMQFVAEQERIYELETGLAYLKGALVAEDQVSAIIYIETLKSYWEQLEN